jgi:anaerobic nitric oxide reductase transcription regulator
MISRTPLETLDALLEVALDLTASLSTEARYQRLLASIRRVVPADATALLRLEDEVLIPLAVDGLSHEVLGRRFAPAEHPRLATILGSHEPVRFAPDDPLPDPYDGIIEASPDHNAHVHSCMGACLRIEGTTVGVLTLDALEPGRFDEVDDRTLATTAALAAAALRTANLIDALEKRAERTGQVARQLVQEALQRGGGERLGRSQAMARLRDELEAVAESDLTVLITGETGTGKELAVRTLHDRSRRRTNPLVYVNCAALPEAIAESELFGHRRGSFTGATEDRPGRFELADGGTLFLDEIGELSPSIQPKLLRALQSGEVQRVGADRTRHVDVRVLAATNRDLEAEVKAGRFRPDLYHRLSVYPVRLPPLREREGDVALLAGHFLDRARLTLGTPPLRLSRGAVARLEAYPWPGNVRELEHVLMRGALRASTRKGEGPVTVEFEHLTVEATASAPDAAPRAPGRGSRVASLREETDAFRRQRIAEAVDDADGNWAAAARSLGVARGNLHRLAVRLGLKPDSSSNS